MIKLFRNVFDQTLLRCVTQDESQRILHEFYYGFFGGHYSGPSTIVKILKASYYFSTMFNDSFKIVQEYDKYNMYVEKRRQDSMPLKPMVVEEPFQQCGLVFIGIINLNYSMIHKFIMIQQITSQDGMKL